jgi:alkyl hydroperoxide reductase subunit AhpC
MYQNTIDVGDEIPSFNLDSQVGRISFHDIIDGKWCLLVTFGAAFEPVATTDLGMLAKLADEFESRNIFILGIGNDTGLFMETNTTDFVYNRI